MTAAVSIPEPIPPSAAVWFGQVEIMPGIMVPAKALEGEGGTLGLMLFPAGRKMLPVTSRQPLRSRQLRPPPDAKVLRRLRRSGCIE